MQYSGGLTPRPGSPSSRYSLVPPELYQWTQVNPHALWLYPNILVQDSCGRLRDRVGFFDSCHQISSKQKVLCDQSQMLILTVHIANCPFHDSDYRCNVRPHNCVWIRASTPFSLCNLAYLIGILSSLHRRHSPSFCGLLEPEAAFLFSGVNCPFQVRQLDRVSRRWLHWRNCWCCLQCLHYCKDSCGCGLRRWSR